MNTATTRDQYSGLNRSGVSTMMNRIGRAPSIDGTVRMTWRIVAEELDVELVESVGMYVPLSRNDLMFDMRRRDDADGDSRMIGSGRGGAAFGLCASVGLLGRFAAAAWAALRALKGAASLRTCEKSWRRRVSRRLPTALGVYIP